MTLNAFGDSITVGNGTGASPWSAEIISSLLNVTVNNYGINGSQIADQMANIFGNTIQDSLFLTGFNDVRFFGSSTTDYEKVLKSAIVWLTSSDKVRGYSMSSSTGTWATAGAYGGILTTYNANPGDTATYSVTGTCVYVSATQINTGSGGVFKVTIDGVDQTTCGCYGNSTVGSGLVYSPTLLRFPGLSNTAHTVVITNISTGSNKTIFIDYVASNAPGNTLVLGQTLTCTTSNYTLGSPTWNKGSDTNVALYNTVISNNVATFSGDGLNVKLAPMLYNPNTQSVSGNVHPTTAGQCNIALCFLNTYSPGWL